MSNWKPYCEMTPEEKFEHDVNRIIHTSIDDAKHVINHTTRDVLLEALSRERNQKTPRVSLIKMLESAIRKHPVAAGVGMYIRFYANTTRPNTTAIGKITKVIKDKDDNVIGFDVENAVMKFSGVVLADVVCVVHSELKL